MTDQTWSAVRAEAIEAFAGQTPRAEDEAAIIEVFETQPTLVQRAIQDVAEQLERRQIIWGWSVLRSRVERGALPLRDVVPEDIGRADAVRKASIWMRNAGLHYDRWDEVEDELFGDHGKLRPWKAEEDLVDEMHALFEQLRPAGERTEVEADERMRRWREARDKVAAPPTLRESDERAESLEQALADSLAATVGVQGNPFLA